MKTSYSNNWGRKCWSSEEKRALLDRFAESGLSAAAFARQQDISPKTFSRWVRDVHKKADIAECAASPIRFQRVVVAAPAPEEMVREVRILLPNGMGVSVSVASLQEIGRLCREVAQC